MLSHSVIFIAQRQAKRNPQNTRRLSRATAGKATQPGHVPLPATSPALRPAEGSGADTPCQPTTFAIPIPLPCSRHARRTKVRGQHSAGEPPRAKKARQAHTPKSPHRPESPLQATRHARRPLHQPQHLFSKFFPSVPNGSRLSRCAERAKRAERSRLEAHVSQRSAYKLHDDA